MSRINLPDNRGRLYASRWLFVFGTHATHCKPLTILNDKVFLSLVQWLVFREKELSTPEASNTRVKLPIDYNYICCLTLTQKSEIP